MQSKPHPSRKRRRKAPPSVAQHSFRTARATMLDRLADAELQHGHVQAAEHLAHRAAALRERGL